MDWDLSRYLMLILPWLETAFKFLIEGIPTLHSINFFLFHGYKQQDLLNSMGSCYYVTRCAKFNISHACCVD